VRSPVGRLNGLLVRSLDKAKRAAGPFFEPVGDEADPEPLLHLAIAQVSLCDIGSRRIRKVVAIHEERHRDRTVLRQSGKRPYATNNRNRYVDYDPGSLPLY